MTLAQRALRFSRWLTLLAALSAGLAQAQSDEPAPAFRVVGGSVAISEGVVYLDARIDLRLSGEARRALHSGVPLTIVLQIHVTRPRWWWLDAEVAELSQRYQIRYHALSSRYILTLLNSGESRTYTDLGVLLGDLGRVTALPLIDRSLLEPREAYDVQLRARLDVESLPRPLRAVAYVSPEWRMVSEWVTWRVDS